MYIKKTYSGGMDWHDAYISVHQLMENGKYEIENAANVIIDDILTEFPYLSKEDLLHTIQNKKVFEFPIQNAEKTGNEYVYSDCDTYSDQNGIFYQNEGKFDGNELTLAASFEWGQFNYTTYYDVEEASPEDIKYLVVEQIYCPTKGVPLVERFYEEPFVDLEDARKYFNELKVHENMNCRKELLIFNTKNQPRIQKWYDDNVKALSLMKENKQDHLDNRFHIFAQHHIDALEKL